MEPPLDLNETLHEWDLVKTAERRLVAFCPYTDTPGEKLAADLTVIIRLLEEARRRYLRGDHLQASSATSRGAAARPPIASRPQ